MRKKAINKWFSKAIACVCVGAILLTTSGCGVVKIEKEESEHATESNEEETGKIANFDEAIRPQDDFYGAVNKSTILSYELNRQEIVAGAGIDIQNKINKEIETMVEEYARNDADYKKGSSEWALKTSYEQLLDLADSGESAAKADFLSYVDKVNAIQSKEDVIAFFKEMKDEYGICDLLDFDVSTDYKKSNENALYIWQESQQFGTALKELYENNETRKSLNDFIVDVLVMCGWNQDKAVKEAKQYMYYVVDIACQTDFSLTEVANPYAVFYKYSKDEFNRNMDGVTMEEVKQAFHIPECIDGIYVYDIEQTSAILNLLKEENIDLAKTYFLCAYVKQYQNFLIQEYDVLNAYTTRVDKENLKAIADVFAETMELQISELYGDWYFTEEMKEQLLKMQRDIADSYEQLILNADWLSQDGKDGLLLKLHNMKFIYGGGKKSLTNEDNISCIGKDFYETYRNVKVFRLNKLTEQLQEKPDLEVTDMSSQMVNAQYASANVFTITVGIMHAPYFDVNASYEENLGGLGVVIGHEMGHAFDSNGMKFDPNGNYDENWLPEVDQQVLEKRQINMEDYYSSYTVMDVYHVDGKNTVAENYADLGSMECLMNIVKEPEKQKKLFENYAKILCEYSEDTNVIEALVHDEHSPSIIRVNAVLSTIPEFYKAYDVKAGDGMYVDSDKRVSRWH